MKITARHVLGNRPPIDLDGEGWIIEFGDDRERIEVAVGSAGKVDVRSPNGGTIKIEPRAANSVWISINQD